MQHIGALLVRDVMQKVRSVNPDTPIPKLVAIFKKEQTDALAVVDKDGKFLGDVHKRDLLKLVVDPKDVSWDDVTGLFGRQVDYGYFAETVKDLMRGHEITINPTDTVRSAVGIMFKHRLEVLPVVDNGKLVGMLTELCILDRMYKEVKHG